MNAQIIFTVVALCSVQLSKGDLLSDLREQVNGTVSNIQQQAQNLLTQAQQSVQNAIDQAESELNAQLQQIQEQVQQDVISQLPDLSNIGEDVSACMDAEEANLTSIMDTAQNQFTGFIAKEGLLYILPYYGKVNKTINNIKTLGTNAVQGVQSCVNQGFLKAITCMTALAATVTSQAASVGSEISAEAQQLPTLLSQVMSDLQTTVSNVVSTAMEEAAAIGQETVECVTGKIGL